MTIPQLNNYNFLPVFDDEDNFNQKIKIKEKESNEIIGTIKMIKKENCYETYVCREDLTNDIFMGNIRDNKEIGTKLAFIARKMISS